MVVNLCSICAVMRRDAYPSEVVLDTLSVDSTLYQPGHTIRLLPPLIITNLLPVDLGFTVVGQCPMEKLKAGEETNLHLVRGLVTL